VSTLADSPLNVLLIDDQAMVGEAVRRMLAGETDITFHFCQDPTKAIERALDVRPTVILQDLVMPGVDGLELVRAFRAQPETADVPMIVLSSKEEPAVKMEAFARGANDYIVKLPNKLELIARIRYHSRAYNSRLERDEAFRQLERRNAFIRDTFGRYVSDEVVDSILASPEGMSLGGETRRVTILMADLRGFTAISEGLPPEKVVRLINNYLDVMTDVIMTYGGTINEFIGDAILAIFGAPVWRGDHAERAVASAVAMQLAMAKVNEKNHSEGLPHVEMGIGIHTGEVVAGNIGSHRRVKYGIVGANVNQTSRIESCTTGGQVFISVETRRDAGAILRIDGQMEAELKGMKSPITIFEVGGIGEPYNLSMPVRDAGLVTLTDEIPIRYAVLEGKSTAGVMGTGALRRLSEHEAEVRGAQLKAATDLKLQLIGPDGGELLDVFYAKVLARYPQERSGFAMRFTQLPAAVAAFLRDRISRSSR
jgi:adenylate cyclase